MVEPWYSFLMQASTACGNIRGMMFTALHMIARVCRNLAGDVVGVTRRRKSVAAEKRGDGASRQQR